MKSYKNSSLILSIFCLLLTVVALITLPALLNRKNAKETALEVLHCSVARPETVKINSISDPDTIYNNVIIKPEEKIELGMMLMNMNDRIMNSENITPATLELADRQMSAMSMLGNIFDVDLDTVQHDRKQTGWRVKIDYSAVSAKGNPYRSEFWCILTKPGNQCIKSFEIPIIQ